MIMSSDEPEHLFRDNTLADLIDVGRSHYTQPFPELPENDLVFAKTITALGNSEGGVILIGVEEDGEIKGISNANTIKQEIADIIDQHTDPAPTYKSRTESYGSEGKIIVILVEEFSSMPHAVTWEGEYTGEQKETVYVFYDRMDIYCRSLSPYELRELITE